MSAQVGSAPPLPRSGRTPTRIRSSLARMWLTPAAGRISGNIAAALGFLKAATLAVYGDSIAAGHAQAIAISAITTDGVYDHDR